MCSIEQRLEEIGRAIEELAIQAGMPAEIEADETFSEVTLATDAASPASEASTGGVASIETISSAVAIEPDDSSRILARLAELWGLLADLDPEVARRLAGYQALLSPDTKSECADRSCLGRPTHNARLSLKANRTPGGAAGQQQQGANVAKSVQAALATKSQRGDPSVYWEPTCRQRGSSY